MIDILSIQSGDVVEYGPYQCSESLMHERFTGIYQGFDFWTPDERPAELWLELIGRSEPSKGLNIRIRASQVTNIHRGNSNEQ